MYKFYKYNQGNIVYSIVTPIYNQESIIVKNIKSLLISRIIILKLFILTKVQKIYSTTQRLILKNKSLISMSIN